MAEFQEYDRSRWSARRAVVPPNLAGSNGLATFGGVDHGDLLDIYWPLAELVAGRAADRHAVGAPYLVAVVGSVAVGKSTAARALSGVLALDLPGRRVDVVSTDGFLFPNRELAARGLVDRKGFPESYDIAALSQFLAAVQRGQPEVHAPVYSHEVYDVIDDTQAVCKPEVLILEGMPLANDQVDLSIYVDAAEADIEQWFVTRFLALCVEALEDDTSFFRMFSGYDPQQQMAMARDVWATINAVNLHEHILPTRDACDVILEKGPDHTVERVLLRT